MYVYSTLQIKNAVTVYLKSKQLLSLDFVQNWQYTISYTRNERHDA